MNEITGWIKSHKNKGRSTADLPFIYTPGSIESPVIVARLLSGVSEEKAANLV